MMEIGHFAFGFGPGSLQEFHCLHFFSPLDLFYFHLLNSHCSDQKDDKESDKLDRDGAAQTTTRQAQPRPPGWAEGDRRQVPKLDHGVGGSRDEKQEDGIQQDVSVEGQQADV